MTLLDLADNELRPASPGHDAEHAHAVGSSLCAASANGSAASGASAASGSAAAGPHRAGTGKVQELRPGDPRVIGPYRLLGQLGGGGMGRVFLGVSAGGRPVAVKVIRPELVADPEFRTRFRREVAAARTVSGLFTALVVDADTEAPAPWLATAYVAGPSLAQAVRDSGPLSADSVLALAVGLAESLAAIHAVGVVHRDLKPSNVLLAEDGPRVIDFGISWAIEATSLTNAGFVVGSPGFMSPEQAEGGIVGPPSDMFSLGAVLAFSATGEGPFGGGSTAALVYRVVHSSPDLSRLPSQVRPLVEHCLAKDPSQRPAAVDFLAQAGPGRRVTGWLGTPVIPAFNWNPAPHSDPAPLADPIPPDANRTVTVGKQLPSPWPVTLQPSFPPPTPPAAASRIRRPRFWRPLTIAWVCGTLLAAFAVAGFALHHGGTQAPAAQAPVAHSKQLPGRSLTDSPAISASPAVSASASARTSPSASASPPARKIARTSPSATSTAQPVRSTAPPVAKPTHQYLFDVKGASWYSCSDEGSIHSVPSTSEELFTFVNNSSTTLQIIWLNFGGSRQLYDVLGPGQSYNVDTYIGHDWLIASPGSGCLGIFGINGSGQIVTSS